MTWRPKCRKCWRIIEPGQPRRRLYDTALTRVPGGFWLSWGCFLCPDCYAELETEARR